MGLGRVNGTGVVYVCRNGWLRMGKSGIDINVEVL